MLAPVIATGNTAVVIASEQRPLAAVTLTEVLATSDLPGGVVNVLTGRTAELAPVLAGHMDVNAIDLTGVPPAGRPDLERLAAENVKRVFAADEDWTARAGHPAAARVPGDQDRLAPDRDLRANAVQSAFCGSGQMAEPAAGESAARRGHPVPPARSSRTRAGVVNRWHLRPMVCAAWMFSPRSSTNTT